MPQMSAAERSVLIVNLSLVFEGSVDIPDVAGGSVFFWAIHGRWILFESL
jgi:hypothetical protein